MLRKQASDQPRPMQGLERPSIPRQPDRRDCGPGCFVIRASCCPHHACPISVVYQQMTVSETEGRGGPKAHDRSSRLQRWVPLFQFFHLLAGIDAGLRSVNEQNNASALLSGIDNSSNDTWQTSQWTGPGPYLKLLSADAAEKRQPQPQPGSP